MAETSYTNTGYDVTSDLEPGFVTENKEKKPSTGTEGPVDVENDLFTGEGGSGVKVLPIKIRFFVYLSHSLSSWGDRMWSFGVGLFMVIISPDSLRLTAIYGFASGSAVLLLGAVVGDWIDRTPRLSAARTTLVIQNMSVLVCAVCIFFVITYKPEIVVYWPNEGLLILCYAGIIMIAVVSTLASMGTKISVQRDWIVEICGRDKDALASMSSTMRAIDLVTLTVAPILTGQIMTYASTSVGALFIGGWNLVSVFVEYYLLWKVYDIVPALRKTKFKSRQDKGEPKHVVNGEANITQQEVETGETELNTSERKAKGKQKREETNKTELDTSDREGNDRLKRLETDKTESNNCGRKENDEANSRQKRVETSNKEVDLSSREIREIIDHGKQDVAVVNEQKPGSTVDREICKLSTTDENKRTGSCSRCPRPFLGVLIFIQGWKTYMKYDVAFAGLGLSLLYMTVLGFDNITVGFGYSQGINESIMGILMAGGGLVGVCGALLYPIVRRSVGLERTGLFGCSFQTIFLSLCVASVWAPGSPFDLQYTQRGQLSVPAVNDTFTITHTTSVVNLLSLSDPVRYSTVSSENISSLMVENVTSSVQYTLFERPNSYISIWLLLAGIIGARCGLWMADLTITQLFLENVEESQRGIVNGVQTSLNQLMDMLKFVMVIIAPQPEVFGLLILVSFGFVLSGWLFYAKYCHKARGHLFHFDKIKQCECVSALFLMTLK